MGKNALRLFFVLGLLAGGIIGPKPVEAGLYDQCPSYCGDSQCTCIFECWPDPNYTWGCKCDEDCIAS